jgi:hypothetical protein
MHSNGTNSAVEGSLKYLVPTDNLKTEKPFMSSVPFTKADSKTSNFMERSHAVSIRDIRAMEGTKPTLDENGFEYVTHSFQCHPTDKIEGPDDPYLTEVASFLMEHFACKDVVVYDCNVYIVPRSRRRNNC